MNEGIGDKRADVLLIGGGFFNYAKEIVRVLERRGRAVVAFEDRPALDTLTKSMIRLAPGLVAPKCEAYFDRIITSVRGLPIRDVLVIKGEALSPAAISRLRGALPDARFTLYFWDSYRNMPKDSPEKVSGFDKAFTFDPVDAHMDRRLQYRPLFFLDEYAHLVRKEQDIDVLFIGTAHSDRYAVLKRLSHSLPDGIRFERKLYFPSRVVCAARRTFDPSFWGSHLDEFTFEPLTKGEIRNLLSRAKVVVDIERSAQCGLTIRTIEMLGAGKKLATTNPRVVDAEFYNPRNITVVDRKRPALTREFLQSEYEPPSPEMLRRYSLSGWVDEVLAD